MCRKCPKKVSAATFTCSGEHAIFADKFGDVYVAATSAPEQVTSPEYKRSGPASHSRASTEMMTDASALNTVRQPSHILRENQSAVAEVSSTCRPKISSTVQRSAACVQAPQLFLGHFCSIITSLTVSPDSQYIVSTDRDHKIRISNMPAQPMQVCIITFSILQCRPCSIQ